MIEHKDNVIGAVIVDSVTAEDPVVLYDSEKLCFNVAYFRPFFDSSYTLNQDALQSVCPRHSLTKLLTAMGISSGKSSI